LPWPAAVQSDEEGQDTPLRPLPLARAGLGVGWARQAAPFHRSPNVTNAPELSTYPPTAAHAEDEVHDTASKKLNCAPDGLGVRWIRQVMPFHRSAKVTSVPELFP